MTIKSHWRCLSMPLSLYMSLKCLENGQFQLLGPHPSVFGGANRQKWIFSKNFFWTFTTDQNDIQKKTCQYFLKIVTFFWLIPPTPRCRKAPHRIGWLVRKADAGCRLLRASEISRSIIPDTCICLGRHPAYKEQWKINVNVIQIRYNKQTKILSQ